MEINVKKLERQRKGAFKFFNAKVNGSRYNYWGILNYETGVGKTYTAQIIIKMMSEKSPALNVVVLVPSDALVKQWERDNSNIFSKNLLSHIKVVSATQMLNSQYTLYTDLLVIDEVHEFYTPERYKLIDNVKGKIKYKYCLGLTATVKHPKGWHTKVTDWLPVVDTITEQEALKEGFISKFLEFNLAVNLTEDEQLDYDFYTEQVRKFSSKFGYGGFELARKVLNGGTHTDGKEYEGKHFAFGWAVKNGWRTTLDASNAEDYAILKEWSPNVIMGYARELMKAVRERTGLLYNCENKIYVAVDVINKYNLKTICFGQSTNFADRLNLTLNRQQENTSVVYHSKLQTIMAPSPKTGKTIKMGATRLKKAAIEAIQTGASKVICTASSLDKGFNVKDISLAVNCAGTQNPIQQKQRTGRVKRLEEVYQTDKPVLIVNLYVPKSKDEDWLKKRQEKYRHVVYWIEDVSEINYTPSSNYEFNDI